MTIKHALEAFKQEGVDVEVTVRCSSPPAAEGRDQALDAAPPHLFHRGRCS